MDKPKIFDDFPTVDCNECERWWTNQCDGAKSSSKGSKMPCNSFLATRSVVIPKEIERLKRAFKWLLGVLLVEAVFIVLLALAMWKVIV